jgi:tetratricopeptide (TPR) repeat protein
LLTYLREAETLAEALGDESRRGWALAQLSGAAWITGDHTQALALGKPAYEIAVTAADFALRVHMSLRLGWAYQALGDYRQAMPFFRENVTSVQGDLVRERFGHVALPAVHSRLWLGWCLAELGEFTEALSHAEDGLRIADAADHMLSQILALFALGMIRLRAGDLPKAIPPLERSHQFCEAAQAVGWMAFGTSFLGLAYAQSGRVDEALPLLEAVVDAMESGKQLFWQPIRVAALGEAYLRAGRIDDAWAQGRRALDLARRQGERGHEAWSQRLLGEIASHRDPAEVESAEEHYRQALTLADELSMRPLVAHCHLGLGKLYCRTGDCAKSQEHLTTAAALYREMDMRFWLEQAEATLKELG